MTDPIADFLTRLRNALAVRKREVRMPYSTLKHRLADVLVAAGYLEGVTKLDEGYGVLSVTLRYDDGGRPTLTHLERVSTPGRRVYAGYGDLKPVCSGRGLAVLSTSRGLMTDRQAREQKVGGELMCQVW